MPNNSVTQSNQTAAGADLSALRQVVKERSFPSLEEVYGLEANSEDSTLSSIYSELAIIRETLRNFANGNFDLEIPIRGAMAGYLKTLQANMRHLTWQVEQVAGGDFSQHVDFMGEFSKSFNSLTLQLEQFVAEQKEHEAIERIKIMLDATPLSCCLINENMEHIDCNLAAVKLFDLENKAEYLNRFAELSPKFQPNGQSSAVMTREKISEAFAKGHVSFQWLHQKLNGEPIPAEIELVRVWQNDHYIVAGYTRDLRELKETQNALERERLLLLDILNKSPVCFTIIIDDIVQFVNPFMQQFFGVEIGEELSDYLAQKSMVEDIKADFEKEAIISWRSVSMRTKSGETKEMLVNAFPVNYYDTESVMVWLVDVTQIRKIEVDLRKAKETAEDLARVKGEFLANMSHEIRTPMNAIIGMMHLVRSTRLSKKQFTYIDTAEKSAQLLLRIINDILDFSKIEAGKLTMEVSAFSIADTINEVVSVIQEQADQKGLALKTVIAPQIPDKVIGDAIRLKQVLLNLLNNAVKFTSDGSVVLEAFLRELQPDNATLFFKITDTGIGISLSEQKRLLQPFNQADSSTTRKYGGTGLGLSISKSLIEMMGGEIGYKSQKGQGSCFYFTANFKLPQPDTVKHEVLRETTAEDIVIPPHLHNLPILLAEDNIINQMVATELLEAKGFDVDIASNGLEAVTMLNQKNYGLVLMDIQMPEMDGLQATRLIRQKPQYASLPILAMTANAMGIDRKMCMEAGMNDHIAKPIDPKNLYNSIIKWAKVPNA